jgi:pimeloyl-ACP methyl ester carboxylesterase
MVKKPDRAGSRPELRPDKPGYVPGGGVLRDVSTRGVRTRVLEAGSDRSPALVLVHGLFASHRSFEDLIEDLSARFHVLAPDLPGFGESEKPSPARYAYGIEAHAEAVVDMIAAFGVGRASIVGHGIGGAVALTVAADHRELVTRLVVEDSLAYPAPRSLRARVPLIPIVGGIAFKQLYGRSIFRSIFREEMYAPGLSPPLSRIDWHYDIFNSPSARESAHATMLATRDTRPVVARLPRIVAPTLVLWGHDDRIYPASSAHRLAREIPGARLEIMDAGHVPHEERPREFLAHLVQFLEGKRG